MTIGHPPLSDILMAATNRILWGKFGLVGDIESYEVYVLLMTLFMVVLVGCWSYLVFGPVASFFSVCSLITLPLLFAEQHFNIKDPLVASYYTGALFFLWFAVEYKKYWPVFVSAIFFGLSLGTKFNIVFSVFILIPWFISLRWWEKKPLRRIVITSCIVIPIIAYGMFFISYPALWSSPIQKTFQVIQYYLGVSNAANSCGYYFGTIPWFVHCSDWNTIVVLCTSMPIPTLLFFLTGSVIGWKYAFGKSSAVFLWLLWIFVTVGRATIPLEYLYGGSLRQIMEYMIPLSLLCGVAVEHVMRLQKRRAIRQIIILIAISGYIPIIYTMVQLHPNENVYYNALIGGLPGAMKYGLDGANNTYGNAYKQGALWINAHAELGSKIALGTAIFSAVPTVYFRNDLVLVGTNSDLYAQQGEYVMELTYPGLNVNDFFRMRFLRNMLTPVYTVQIDGVPLLYIWKNDPLHLAHGVDMTHERNEKFEVTEKASDLLELRMEKQNRVKRIEFNFVKPECAYPIASAYIFGSSDGTTWYRFSEQPADFAGELNVYPDSRAVEQFAGEELQGIRIFQQNLGTCQWKDISIRVIGFP